MVISENIVLLTLYGLSRLYLYIQGLISTIYEKRPWACKRETKGYRKQREGYNFINLKKLKSRTALSPSYMALFLFW